MDYVDWRLGPPQLEKAQALAKVLAQPPAENGYWQQTWPGAETTNVHIVDKHPYGEGVQGWTVCDKNKRLCDILIQRNADRACVEEHERKHAAGYDHPSHPRGFICNK